MLFETTEIEGKPAFVVDRKDTGLSRFLGGDFSTVHFLMNERNQFVQAKVSSDLELDPMGCDHDVLAPSSKRQLLECVHGAETKWLAIDVEGATVNALATSGIRNTLCMDIRR